MRVQTEEWRRFIPGVRMYRGKMTLFYNGEELWNMGRYLIYTFEERQTWEVIIILPGVEEIPNQSFSNCMNVKTVIMSDSVRRCEFYAFCNCRSLVFVRLSINLEYIGESTFCHCLSLSSIFIPPSCREIGNGAFADCQKLMIFSVPQHTQLGLDVIQDTALSAILNTASSYLNLGANATENECIKNINRNDEYELHRACSSFNPLENILLGVLKRQGLAAFRKQNAIGITPLQYLEENPYAEIDQHKLIKRYIAEMMGEY